MVVKTLTTKSSWKGHACFIHEKLKWITCYGAGKWAIQQKLVVVIISMENHKWEKTHSAMGNSSEHVIKKQYTKKHQNDSIPISLNTYKTWNLYYNVKLKLFYF